MISTEWHRLTYLSDLVNPISNTQHIPKHIDTRLHQGQGNVDSLMRSGLSFSHPVLLPYEVGIRGRNLSFRL
jgi:hypothetical protein